MISNRSGLSICRTTVSVLAFGFCLCSANYATAQNAPNSVPAEAALDEVVVTARKVSENVQYVPVAVTAFTGVELQQQGAIQIADIAKLTPGLIITPAAIGAGAVQFTIRGQVQSNNLATLDPSVGLYVDGLYWARSYGINSNLLDVQNVQTLKGPQGTLFGRNTTGGAILIQTNDPNFRDGLAVLASGTYGSYNQFSGSNVLNLPLIDNKLAVRIAFDRNVRDGYITNTSAGGRKLDDEDDYTIRGKLLYNATDDSTILISAEQYHSDVLSDPFRVQYIAPGSLTASQAAFDIANNGAPGPSSTAAALANDGDRLAINVPPRSYIKTQTFGGTLTVDKSFGEIKAIGGYRKAITAGDIDLDGSPYHALEVTSNQDLEQYSAELQVTGKAFDDKLDFASGVYYFQEEGLDQSYSTALGFLGPKVTLLKVNIDNDSEGVYGQTTYHVDDRLSLTGGLRYSVDNKSAAANNGIFSTGTYAGPSPGATYTCKLPACPNPQSARFSGVSYTAIVDYKLWDDSFVYAKTAKSFRSGGQNGRGTVDFPGSAVPFEPETAKSYEVGVKNEFFDGQLRVNVAGYFTTDTNIQGTTVLANASGNTATTVTNAGRADFYGAEIEVNALLPAGFRIDGSAAYTHPEYDSYVDPTTHVDRSRERFYGIASWTASLSPSWSHEFSFGKLMLRGDAAYQSDMSLYAIGFFANGAGQTIDATTGRVVDPTTAAALLNGTTDEAHILVNARASLTLLDGKLDLALWGANLTDRRDLVAAYPFTSLGTVSAIERAPRTVGITATLHWSDAPN
jgi:iron complex outermembrane receptor protein